MPLHRHFSRTFLPSFLSLDPFFSRRMHINAAAVLVYILANKQRYFSASHAALDALVLALRCVDD